MPENDKHIRRTGDDYATGLANLLPEGLAWPRNASSTVMKTVKGLAQVWGLVDRRAGDLLEQESDPRITLELLPEWERAFGLPDPCYSAPQTIAGRQLALVLKMTTQGAQDREFYTKVAARLGYTITISEYRPFQVGIDGVGDTRVRGVAPLPMRNNWHQYIYDPLGKKISVGQTSEWPHYGIGPPENRYYWTVHVNTAKLIWFRVGAGGGQTGVDPHLRIGLADDLECILRRWMPAHTRVIFDYSNVSIENSGTLFGSEKNDTAVFLGGVTSIYIGPLAAVESKDAAAFTGIISVTGTLAATEAKDTASFVTVPLSGSLSVSENSDTATFSGTVTSAFSYIGTLAATEAKDIAAFTGTSITVNSGTLAAVEALDTAVFATSAGVFGTLVVTEAVDVALFQELLPVLLWNSGPTDNTPEWIVVTDNSIVTGGAVQFQVAAPGTLFASPIVDNTHSITSGESTSLAINLSLSALADGSYEARCRVAPPSTPTVFGQWSNVVPFSISGAGGIDFSDPDSSQYIPIIF